MSTTIYVGHVLYIQDPWTPPETRRLDKIPRRKPPPKAQLVPPHHSDSTQGRSHPSIPAAQHEVMSQECKGPMLHHTSQTHTRIYLYCMGPPPTKG